jgi:hypothetical protein
MVNSPSTLVYSGEFESNNGFIVKITSESEEGKNLIYVYES